MAAMSRLLGAVTVMAFTVISSTAAPFIGKPVDPNCGVICSNLERPYDGAVCYETKREDGTCQPVWVNTAMLSTRGDGLKDVNHTVPSGHHHNPAPFAGNLPMINDREDAGTAENSLAKRLQFDLAPKPQRVCRYIGPTCMDPSRDKGAKSGDCEDLIRFWYNNHGKWTIQKRDLEGRHYLELAQSGSCLYAVGHPHLSAQANDTVVGNSDIWATLAQGFNECDTNDKMEVQGMLDCDDWNLFLQGQVRVLQGRASPQRVRKRTNRNLGYEALDSVLGTCTLEVEKGTWLLAFVKHHRHTEELQR